MISQIISIDEMVATMNNCFYRSDIQRKLCMGTSGITSYMANKIAKSGLSYKHLQLAYARDHEHGIRLLLSEKHNNKASVTTKRAVIDKIKQHFTEQIRITEQS